MSSCPSRCSGESASNVDDTHDAGDADAVALTDGVALALALTVGEATDGAGAVCAGAEEHPESTTARAPTPTPAPTRARERGCRFVTEVTGRRYVIARHPP